MEFDHYCYKVNKFFLSILGFWPYQTKLEKNIRRCVLFIILWSNFPPMIKHFYYIWGDIDRMIYYLIFTISFVLSMIKILKAAISDKETKNLLEQIKFDRSIWYSKPEFATLEKYAEEGRKLTLIYTVATYFSIAFYFVFTISPQILNYMNPLSNMTREKTNTIPQDFSITTGKYFIYICMFSVVSIYANFTVTLGMDTMYIVFAQHACGIFATLGHRFENIDKIAESQENAENYNKFLTREFFFCFQQYGNALKYAANVEENYTNYFLFLTGFNVLILILSGVQTVISFGNVTEVVKFSNYSILLLVHLFYHFMSGQKLMDHSLMISEAAYNSCWYEMPKSLKKSLIVVLFRSSKPCKISIGKIYVMSVNNFATVIRIILSYITILLSLR